LVFWLGWLWGRDAGEALALAGSAAPSPVRDAEACAVGGADQEGSVLQDHPAVGLLKRKARMGTAVFKGGDPPAASHKDQTEARLAVREIEAQGGRLRQVRHQGESSPFRRF
jgi:hypothetical protein